MTAILMKNLVGMRRAFPISKADADAMVAAGDAVQDRVYLGIYEEVTPGERDQGYMTRSMQAVTPAKRGPGRPPKPQPAPVVAESEGGEV